MFRFLIIAVCVSLAHATTVGVCPGNLPATTAVNIVGCNAVPCILVRGDNVTGIIDFQTRELTKFGRFANLLTCFCPPLAFATATLRPRVKFILESATGEFPMPNEQQNACNHLINSSCPLDATEDVTWQLTMPVLEEYPAEVSLTLEVSLIGDSDQVVTCFNVLTVVV
jgi:ML domain